MLNSLRVGFFLAVKYIRHANIWMTVLVVSVMILTFLNLVVITGILVGLIAGSEASFSEEYAGDILISTLPDKSYIEQSSQVMATLDSIPEIERYSARYLASGSIEGNYQRDLGQTNKLPDSASAQVVGIDPIVESRVTGLDKNLIEGEYLLSDDEDQIILGGYLVDRYLPVGTGFETISDIYPGDKILLKINEIEKEMTVKGIVRSKADQVALRAYILDTELRKLIERNDYNLGEIAVQIKPGADAKMVAQSISKRGVSDFALVRTAKEAIGRFLDDIKTTMTTLGNVIGAIGLAVASITIFIVIFITAITKQKSIGILKGIGVTNLAIEFSYVLLSVFYSTIGIFIGVLLVYLVLVPYFQANPIDFPFSDGILSVTTVGTTTRATLIMITTIIAGYVPARIVVGKRALDAILGR